jgi:uncharacterized membrane protein YphA (DoxX/SURF4 family)
MKLLSHIVQGLLTLVFLAAGLTKLFSSREQIREMYTESLGYSPTFMYVIGAIELIAALMLIAGYRWRHIAAGSSLMLIVVMIGAVVSNLMVNAAADAIVPAVYLILLIALLVRWIRIEAAMRFRLQ